jgi:DNA-binding IclR family transcriptional regulator
VFKENIDKTRRMMIGNYWTIKALCMSCGRDLSSEEARKTLNNMYSKEIAEIIYQAYMHKSEFYTYCKQLTEKGILCSFSNK